MGDTTVKILVVDDEKVIRDFLTRFLKLSDLEVDAVDNGIDAAALARATPYDVIFLDVRMPKVDGLETLRELKKILPKARYVMMTGYAVDDLLQQAHNEGASSSIRKPFDISQIGMILKEHTDKRSSAKVVRVLVVDDEEVVRDFFTRLLKDPAYELSCARDKEEALALIKERDFDLVFMDMVINETSGVELYTRIREIKPGLEIVLITGHPAEARKIADQPMIKGCLYKPFEIDRIIEEINKVKKS